MKDVYSAIKPVFHPEIVKAISEGTSHTLPPKLCHLMIANHCQQNCSFCSYRLDGNKNAVNFDDTVHIPFEKLMEIIDDLEEMGTKAVELTGGGEPLIYPNMKGLLERLSRSPLEVGLVSNGVAMIDRTADALYETNFLWGRISIDSGSPETYSKIRRVPEKQWDMAWDGVNRLISRRQDQVIGCGFVVTDENWGEVYDFIKIASEHGVDNVRISVAFTPKGADIITEDQVKSVTRQINKGKKEFESESFSIPGIFEERVDNLRLSPTQEYDFCGTKDILCVIEGSQNVYTCCSLAMMKEGMVGSVKNQRFKDLWESKANWRKNFNVRKRCKVVCLYESKNMEMIKLQKKPNHLNFV